ncbi:hypothetical protein NDU88_001564 [Pleurodeles waltl]|uniref:Uncharacterized protein n=1 Tax=Pleurodeles waltl TaxID=8319 RepID=A0AAV7LA51_PLEWA|nr:hypothetical protein NDU88_001564 [Pleurodeles waltl]
MDLAYFTAVRQALASSPALGHLDYKSRSGILTQSFPDKHVERAADIVLGHPLRLAVLHAVAALLLRSSNQHLPVQHQTRYEQALLGDTNLTIIRCTTLNLATLLPTAEDGKPHDCTQVVAITTTPCPDLTDTLLLKANTILYNDGSACGMYVVLYVLGTRYAHNSLY